MPKVYEFLANGFEEIEGLAPVDILRRGGVDVKTISITGDLFVETSHGVTVKADIKFEDVADFNDADLLLLPGGMPGSTNLNAHEGVKTALKKQFEAGKRVGAICAAPMVLASCGILDGKKATCSQVLSVISTHQQPILASSFKSMETLQRVKVRQHLYHIPIHF